ncbi:MAG: glutamine synthetase family protein [Gammaproteobacteria bacterium]|nr:glutamine synthetase family protein [Gammaproteobacteria bacterium]
MDITQASAWLDAESIHRVEVLMPDLAGIGRGKLIPRNQFLDDWRGGNLRVPNSLLGLGIEGHFVETRPLGDMEEDLILEPDASTLVATPWGATPTASIICSASFDGQPASFTPRDLLQQIVAAFTDRGWAPIVAPELEFFLLPVNGTDKRVEQFSPFAVDTTFSALFDDIYRYADRQKVAINTLVQEAGQGQFEINMKHDAPLTVADQVFYFKRITHQAAADHNLHASFMAKPYPKDYGSAMHIHQSLMSTTSGENLFATAAEETTPLFLSYIAGLQKYLPAVMPLIAPYVNSYLRVGSDMSAPGNTHWGWDNRSAGLRVPFGGYESRRVENRVPGSDVNPYLAIAANLACGYLGMVEQLTPSAPLKDAGYGRRSQRLPRHYLAGLEALERCRPVRKLFGQQFVELFIDVKESEYLTHHQELNQWEIDNLLNRV